jgi:hypothetical protein
MTDWKKELTQDLNVLYALRDEVRLQMHLGSLEAKQKWEQLEPEIERLQDSAVQISKQSVAQMTQAVREFKDNLKKVAH